MNMPESKATRQSSEEATSLCTNNGRHPTEITRVQVFLHP